MKISHLILFPLLYVACTSSSPNPSAKDKFKIYAQPSTLPNKCLGFDSPKAINHIASIENEYFNNSKKTQSRYYGTVWREHAELYYPMGNERSQYEIYAEKIGTPRPDSMHCTLYATAGLRAGFKGFAAVDAYHKEIWKDREYAGWSIGYILARHYGWDAYLILSKQSKEYKRCIKWYNKEQVYNVWGQPDIPLKGMFDFNMDKAAIDSLLQQHEFGWGFSEQGWHTWITRFDTLKECNWAGSPSINYGFTPLFLKTKFTEYRDYDSHVVIFPKKVGE